MEPLYAAEATLVRTQGDLGTDAFGLRCQASFAAASFAAATFARRVCLWGFAQGLCCAVASGPMWVLGSSRLVLRVVGSCRLGFVQTGLLLRQRTYRSMASANRSCRLGRTGHSGRMMPWAIGRSHHPLSLGLPLTLGPGRKKSVDWKDPSSSCVNQQHH